MTSNNIPTVDLVIVARNEEKRLGQLLGAIAKQDYPQERIKVYIVDNGSVDSTQAIAAKSGGKLLNCDGTVAQCRNTGIHAGDGELVAFLDAHAVPVPRWARSMVSRFDDITVGGCMGEIKDVCDDGITQWLAKASIFATPESIRDHTIAGKNSSYPWIPTGNCMYRRSALEDAGACNPGLFRCEDTDLAWRTFLLGYQLVYEPAASVVHYDRSTIAEYLRKHFNYGVGASQLAHAYGLRGKRKTEDSNNRNFASRLLKFLYEAGYQYGESSIRRGKIESPPQYQRTPVKDSFRPTFRWTDKMALKVSPEIVYWSVAPDSTIAVSALSNQRYVFNDTSNQIFQSLRKGQSRDETIESLCKVFSAEAKDVESDVDDYVTHLLEEKIILRCDTQ